MRMSQKFAAQMFAAIALALASCSPHADGGATAFARETPARHAESGLPVAPLTVHRGNARLAFKVEVASTSAEQAKGLMFRTALGPDEGMIFPMNPPRPAAFWMRNTVIPLDIIFIGVDGRILNIAANAEPYSERPLPSAGEVKGVLELRGGRAAELGIVPGDKVTW
ncbi:MAG: DUF192 domain-containing protein [Novosphingobium sp.]